MSKNIEDLTDKLESLGLKSESKLIKIILNEKILTCESTILKEKSKYFEAFLNFDPTQEEIEIKGGIEEDACQIIIEYFNGADLNLNLENFQDVLQGLQPEFKNYNIYNFPNSLSFGSVIVCNIWTPTPFVSILHMNILT